MEKEIKSNHGSISNEQGRVEVAWVDCKWLIIEVYIKKGFIKAWRKEAEVALLQFDFNGELEQEREE